MDISSVKSAAPVTTLHEPAFKASTDAFASVSAPVAAPVTRKQVDEAVATMQEFVHSAKRNINFSVDDGSGRVLVKVTDAGSGDVIRQIPSEEAVRLAENLTEVRSLLFSAEA